MPILLLQSVHYFHKKIINFCIRYLINLIYGCVILTVCTVIWYFIHKLITVININLEQVIVTLVNYKVLVMWVCE